MNINPGNNTIQSALNEMEAIRDELSSGKVEIDDVANMISRSAILHKQIQDHLRSASEIIDQATIANSTPAPSSRS
jgi:exonuclease VII small subunit